MDSVITEHPHLTYDDLKFSCEVNHENDDIGLLTCSYEWEETDEEFIERQNRIKEEQEQEFNQIQQLVTKFNKKFNKDLIITYYK